MKGDGERNKKKPLALDWKTLLADHDDELPPELIIKSAATVTGTEPSEVSSMVNHHPQHSNFEQLSDHELNESIARQYKNLGKLGPIMKDKGWKIQIALDGLKEERERRKLRRLEKDADVCEKPTQSMSPVIIGASDELMQENESSETHSDSSFASQFCIKMEDNKNCVTVDAFDEELSLLSPSVRRRKRSNGKVSPKQRQKGQSSPRQRPFQSPYSLSFNGGSNGYLKDRTSDFHQDGGTLSGCSTMNSVRNDAFQAPPSKNLRPRKEHTVVLVDEEVDEEDPQIIETTLAEKLPECMKEAKIYYPSRDDPESVEICYADTECLAPQGYLTSTIMNFYIRYLQQQASPTNRVICDYHFFSTYFYKKLKEAVSYKGNDKYTFFVKFRRWWKGVNIFQKAYVFIPIHEDLHWSLVIICLPDKEDESGPIILHLDSLGLHSSKSIFDNIRSFMRDEWNYLNKEVHPSDLPIADDIWKHLPCKIDEKRILVPQQKNDYDCGLFVLFFMERFIEEAPERLKKKDLAMFNKQWFKPEEASDLRVKVRNLLKEEFRNASDACCISESSQLSSGET